jgi:hypothetical protein
MLINDRAHDGRGNLSNSTAITTNQAPGDWGSKDSICACPRWTATIDDEMQLSQSRSAGVSACNEYAEAGKVRW